MYYGNYPGFMQKCSYPYMKKGPCYYRMAVTGKGRVAPVPDVASVVLGVVTEGSKLAVIQQENAARMTRIIDILLKMGIREKDIGTNSYIISAVYDYIDNKQTFKGYRVMNTIKVDLKDVQKAGELIDAAVSSGANLVENIEFTLSDPSMYYREALSLAAQDAVENAKVIGRTLDVTVNLVPVSIAEVTNTPIPLSVKSSLTVFESATPIKPSLIHIDASVEAVFTYRKV